MKKILVIGAGRSAVTLIKYLLDHSLENNWQVTVADFSEDLARQAIVGSVNGKAIHFNVMDDTQRVAEISNADIVISMLPASMHFIVAKDCVRLKKDLVTASYISKEIADLDESAKKAGVLLLNEIGVDPGIDHMSAMAVIDDIKEKGGQIISFKSFCGGLVHPDSDNNPWNYKFTWNPRNVVLAGQGTAQYIKKGKYKYLPYSKLFERTDILNVLDAGEFEGYANRDSLIYREVYGIEDVQTLYRGTLRRKGYAEAWNIFVQLGITDDSFNIENSDCISNREFVNMFLPYSDSLSIEEKICAQFDLTLDSEIFKRLVWLGIFKDTIMGVRNASPAQFLQAILEKKWALGIEDKDMLVMQHQFKFLLNNTEQKLNSSLLVFGDDPRYTAMAKTVGLPVAIATKLILNKQIKSKGVRIPISKDIYIPVLKELSENGINFIEELI
ncbi:MAG: saccharopine dehydrogenase C-terminal domain-containing protein [Bacteroidota bacterium]|nr:saccharopine dehydrogenase C-terminal domain-containing protein [Bacteroidota bacterium]